MLKVSGKRCNFISIQLSHQVPTTKTSLSRIRTGYERVLAHRTRLPFAYPAEQDGVVQNVNEETQILTVKYKDGEVYHLGYGDEYHNNGGGGFYGSQTISINNLKKGNKFKRGDVLLYNEGFFKPDPLTKQVDATLGYMANVAIMESGVTMEDSSSITRELAEALGSVPVQVRQVTLKSTTNIHQIAEIGAEVKSSSSLMIFDDSDIPEDFDNVDEGLLASLEKLNRSTPKAKYTGKVVKIEAIYKQDPKDMSKSMAKVIRYATKVDKARAEAASESTNADDFMPPKPVASDRYGIVDLDEDTVILRFFIQQTLSADSGDKIVFAGSLKSVIAGVQAETMQAEDGTPVHALMSGLSISNRIIASANIQGMANRVMEKLETDVLDMYFK